MEQEKIVDPITSGERQEIPDAVENMETEGLGISVESTIANDHNGC